MAKYSKTVIKKKGVKTPAKKTATKKVAPKKKAGVTKAVTKKTAPKKSITAKKSILSKKNTGRSTPKRSARSTKGIPVKTATQIGATNGATESQLPPVEEKSPVISDMLTHSSDMDKKYMQHLLAQNGGNKSIRLSSVKKGGIKPSGKKPLW